MATGDFYNDKTPQLQYKVSTAPTITALRTALSTFNSTSYSTPRLDTMTENDMIYAARLHGLSVTGL